ncbi:MAG TPA: FkbM family methyltransferase [Pyrinomonadaceae bacterium]|nr:FkbM family methyltransferase [Pyrinomonadaceae bacterium]
MKTSVKTIIKQTFPKSVLRWKTRTARRTDPDLYLLANLKQYLAELPDAEKFSGYFAKQHAGIDVGACAGEYSCVMASIFGRVLSIEPTSDMAMLLRRSLPRNCEVIECAMGDAAAEVRLRVPTKDGRRLQALATVANHGFEFSNVGNVDISAVRQLTVDQLVAERQIKPSFIKIDVEGYEGKVLQGASEVIRSFKPLLMIEIEKRHNPLFREIFSLLSGYGYVPYHFLDQKLCVSGSEVVEEAFEYLERNNVASMKAVTASNVTQQYINDFVFVPHI